MLTDTEVITDGHAQHLHTATARYSRQWHRLRGGVSSPVVPENDLSRLAAVEFQVVLLGPSLHVVEFHEPRRLVAGGDDDVGVVGIFAQVDEVSSSARQADDNTSFRVQLCQLTALWLSP